jgi:hypothetical protein
VLPQEHGAEVVHSAGRLLVEVALLVEKTADPSASLGMTKGKSRTLIEVGLLVEKTADPSASLGMTKGESRTLIEVGLLLRKLQIPRLRSG